MAAVKKSYINSDLFKGIVHSKMKILSTLHSISSTTHRRRYVTLSVKTQLKSFFCDLLFLTKKSSFIW